MPVFSIELPDKRVIDIEAADQATAVRGAREWHQANPKDTRPEQSGIGGFLRQLGQGASFGFADEAEAGVRSLFGGRPYGEVVEEVRRGNERYAEENPGTALTANLVGGVVPFVGPAGRLTRLGNAARWAVSGGTLPRQMLRSTGFGGAVGTVGGLGAGEGDLAERLPSAQMGGLFGTVVGGALPPVARAGGAVFDTAARVLAPQSYQRLRQAMTPRAERPPPPPEGGVVFVDNPPPDVANSIEGSLQLMRDRTLQAGGTKAGLERELARLTDTSVPGGIANARRMGPDSVGQDVVAPVDVVPGAARLAGAMVRQYPETQAPASAFISGRQTGITPAGADAADLARRGIPTRERFAGPRDGPRTVGQFNKEYGTTFQGGQGNVMPRGQRGRIFDTYKRMLGIKDSDFHGHAASLTGTRDDIVNAMKEGARARYGTLYRLGERVNLTPAAEPVVLRWEAKAAAAQPPLSDALRRATALFRGRDGRVVRDIKNFDLYGKQYLDDEIGKAFRAGDNAVGRELSTFRDELFAALDTSTDRNISRVASLYRGARAHYSNDMRSQEIIERAATAWGRDVDTAAWLRWYGTLAPEEQKLASFAALWGAERGSVTQDLARDVTGIFRTPKADELIAGMVQMRRTRGRGGTINEGSSAGLLEDRNLRFGRYVDIEAAMPKTRDVILGGSSTARNFQDDLSMAGLETLQNAQGFLQMFSTSQSMWAFGQTIFQKISDRAFGLSADRARELSRIMFTANEVDRAEVLRRLIAIMPADRMARFNELLGRVNRYAAGSVAGTSGAVGAPTPQQGGPYQL